MEIDKDILNDIFGNNYMIEGQQQGGMTNLSYLISSGEKKYIYYQPTKFANETINRENEIKVQLAAVSYGITSMSHYFDKKTGIKINEYIEGESLDKTDYYDIREVVELLKTFHSINVDGVDTLNLRKNLAMYVSYIKGNTLDRNYYLLEQYLERYYDYLDGFDKVLCHHDYQKSNIIKGYDGYYYVIDFEFASYGDPLYDVAAFANNSMDDGIMLLKEYCGDPTSDDYKRFYLYRLYLSLQWYVVATIKARNRENDELGFNFNEVGKYFLDNAISCREIIESL